MDGRAQAYRYRVAAADDCGLESEATITHKTIHLQIRNHQTNGVTLAWDEYEGLSYDEVYILRGPSPDNMERILTLPASVGSYTDTNGPGGILYYQVVLPQAIDCEIGRSSFSVRSNIVSTGDISGTRELNFEVRIFPNPIEDVLQVVTEEKVLAVLVGISGKLVIERELGAGHNIIDTESLEAGTYILQLTSGRSSSSQKIIKIE